MTFRSPGTIHLQHAMLREHSAKLRTSLQTADILLAFACFAGTFALPGMEASPGTHPLDGRLIAIGMISAAAWPLALQRVGLYFSQRSMRMRAIVGQLAIAAALTTALLFSTAFVVTAPVKPLFPLACGLLQLAAITAVRLGVYAALRWARRSGLNFRNVLIVGSGPRAAYVQRVIEGNPSWGLSIVGFMDHREPPLGTAVSGKPLHAFEEMPGVLNDQVIDEVIVACPRSMLGEIVSVVDACALAGIPITLLSDLFGDYLPAPRVTRFGALPALSFAPVHHNRAKIFVKRCIDVTGAAALLVLSSPVLALAALAIRLNSKGPIFFRQSRCGLNGRQFVMHKLRTMYTDAEERKRELAALNEMDGPVFKMKNDPRITCVGRFLRRFSIDELPQIWDVLCGRMSLVGPRPSLPSEVLEYQTFERRRLSMRPGLTCLWQVNGRNKIGFDDWVRLDLEYIDTWSLRNDLKILLKTIPAVVSGSGS